MNSLTESDKIAAIDLGSNSFHMIVSRVINGEIQVVDRLKDTVRLASGLDHDGFLDDVSQRRALECLERFGEVLADVPPSRIRVVGTNTLRRARNGREFLSKARLALGHEIEVISGHEEARLIYLGVAHSIADEGGRRLVCDIGGGSTECIIGERFEPEVTNSLYMGCVTWSHRFFPDGAISSISMTRAELAALQELETIAEPYHRLGWDVAIGSSGTMSAVGTILQSNGWSDGGINEVGLRKLRKRLIKVGEIDKLEFEGLKPDRKPSIAGGVAILSAIFEAFRLQEMRVSSGALREGVLYDLLGRMRHEDRREISIRNVRERFRVDEAQAERVETTARHLLSQASGSWSLNEEEAGMLVAWAAQLHEMGQLVSYSGYHKHGAYLLTHMDLPGFSRDDKELLATLVRTHRRKLTPELFRALPTGQRKLARRLCVVLRLAVVLNRARSDEARPLPKLKAKGSKLTLAFPEAWLESQPLMQADLEQEAEALARVGFDLRSR